MSYAELPLRLASRRQLAAADVEAAYGELVRVIGGTRFVAGTPTTANGLLDYRNFSQEAGINNDHKAAPHSFWSLNAWSRSSTGGVNTIVDTPLPWNGLGLGPEFSATLVGYMVTARSAAPVGPGIATGSFTIKGGALITSYTNNALSLVATAPTRVASSVISFTSPVNAGDTIIFSTLYPFNTLETQVTYWFKSLHVK